MIEVRIERCFFSSDDLFHPAKWTQNSLTIAKAGTVTVTQRRFIISCFVNSMKPDIEKND